MSENILEQFMAITQTSEDIAQNWLVMSEFDLERAVGLYLSSESATEVTDRYGSSSVYAAKKRREEVAFDLDDNHVRTPIPVKKMRLVDSIPQAYRASEAVVGPRTTALTSTFASGALGNGNSLASMYQAPFNLMTGGSFAEAREVCKANQKWLMVNIQHDAVFECHLMNRDVWSNNTLQDYIECSFMFWQQQHTSSDGLQYSTMYKVDKFPHISVVDPRTGGLLWRVDQFISAEALGERIQDFLDRNPAPVANTVPVTSRSVLGLSQSQSNGTAQEHDEELAEALALSLRDRSTGQPGGSSGADTVVDLTQTDLPTLSQSPQTRYRQGDNDSSSSSSSLLSKPPERSTAFSVRKLVSLVDYRLNVDPSSTSSTESVFKVQCRFPSGKRKLVAITAGASILNLAKTVASELQPEGDDGQDISFDLALSYSATTLFQLILARLDQSDIVDFYSDAMSVSLQDVGIIGDTMLYVKQNL